MKLSDLKFDFPPELIALAPQKPSRVMWVENAPSSAAGNAPDPEEISLAELLARIPAGDILVINNTKVLKRRVFAENGVEVLFLDQAGSSENGNLWKVLFPSRKCRVGDELRLPEGFTMRLMEKGRPQLVQVSPPISDHEFHRFGELPLPPYIQQAREERHSRAADEGWYQTAWAEVAGSMAAPTASLHFSRTDLDLLKQRGVDVLELTLHVGLGTFLPVTAEDLNQHAMHSEFYQISPLVWEKLRAAKAEGRKIWALGTTVTRVLEAVARTGVLRGETDILLQEGSEFRMVDRLLTNFHQPESTLLALVAGFSGLARVQSCYHWAIRNKFRLFSYGDLSVWVK